MYVIKNGKMICPACKEFCDYKVFDIEGIESFIACTKCGKIQTEESLKQAEIELATQEVLKQLNEMYPDGIMEFIVYNKPPVMPEDISYNKYSLK